MTQMQREKEFAEHYAQVAQVWYWEACVHIYVKIWWKVTHECIVFAYLQHKHQSGATPLNIGGVRLLAVGAERMPKDSTNNGTVVMQIKTFTLALSRAS